MPTTYVSALVFYPGDRFLIMHPIGLCVIVKATLNVPFVEQFVCVCVCACPVISRLTFIACFRLVSFQGRGQITHRASEAAFSAALTDCLRSSLGT